MAAKQIMLTAEDVKKYEEELEFLKIDFNAVICYYRAAAYLFCKIFEHTLCKIHHTVVVGVCLIKLHKCKLRVVS